MNKPLNVLVGALVGGLTGVGVMLLFAPQSGEKTRSLLRDKGIEFRDQATKDMKKALTQVRSEANRLTTEVKEKAIELKELGQDSLVKSLDLVSNALDDGKKAIKSA